MKRFVLFLSFITVVASGAACWQAYLFLRTEFPDVSLLRTRFPRVIHQGKGVPPVVSLQKTRPEDWVTLKEISREAVGAVVVSEDWAFYQHRGYDVNQIREAIKEDWEEGRFARGASTITQQVVRNVFLTKDKSLWRKIKELYLASRIEETVGKSKILETYLNIAEWGDGIYGIRQAARVYFRKSPAELSPKEGAFLAMLLPSPIRYSQSFRVRQLTDYARETVSSILNKMNQAKYISDETRESEAGKPLSFEAPASSAL